MLTKKEIPHVKHGILYFTIDYKWRYVLRDLDLNNHVRGQLASISEKNGRSMLILYAYLVHIPVKTIALNFGLSQTRIREIIKSSFIAINKCLKNPINIDLTFLEREKKILESKEFLISKKIETHFKSKTELLAIVIKQLESVYICTDRKKVNMFYQLNKISKNYLLSSNNLSDMEINLSLKKLYIEEETYDQFIIEINESIQFEKRPL